MLFHHFPINCKYTFVVNLLEKSNEHESKGNIIRMQARGRRNILNCPLQIKQIKICINKDNTETQKIDLRPFPRCSLPFLRFYFCQYTREQPTSSKSSKTPSLSLTMASQAFQIDLQFLTTDNLVTKKIFISRRNY